MSLHDRILTTLLIAMSIVALVLIVVSILAAVQYFRGEDTETPDATDAPQRIPRTLAKLESYVYCGVGAFLCAMFVWQFLHYLFWWFMPNEWGVYTTVNDVSHLLTVAAGGAVAVIVWITSDLPDIEIGWIGVPTFLGGRFRLFFFPEGKNKGFIGLIRFKPVDMRTHLLVSEGATSSLHIPALVSTKAKPVGVDPNQHLQNSADQQLYVMPVEIIASLPIRVVDGEKWLSFDPADMRVRNSVVAAMREWVVFKDVLDLPFEKEHATDYLKEVAKTFVDVGVEAPDVEILDFVLPGEITKAAIRIPIEEIQASSEGRQGATLAAVASQLRTQFPNLSDEELRNMVLAASNLAELKITSVETTRGNPTFTLVNAGRS